MLGGKVAQPDPLRLDLGDMRGRGGKLGAAALGGADVGGQGLDIGGRSVDRKALGLGAIGEPVPPCDLAARPV